MMPAIAGRVQGTVSLAFEWGYSRIFQRVDVLDFQGFFSAPKKLNLGKKNHVRQKNSVLKKKLRVTPPQISQNLKKKLQELGENLRICEKKTSPHI